MHRLHRLEPGLPARRPDREHERQPVQAFHSAPRSTRTGYRSSAASRSAASPITSTALVRQPRERRRSAASARAVAYRGRTFHRWRAIRSSSSTDVRDDAVRSTVQPSSSFTGRRENRATLCTGPSQVMARSGSRWYAAAFRAYSTAETTLTCSSPAASRSFSSDAVPVTSSAGTRTSPRSIAP